MPDRKVWPNHVFATSRLDYAYAQGLMKQEWAWEFLRRNPDYRRDYITSRARLTRIAHLSNNIPVVRPRGHQSGARNWGLACYSHPNKTAHQTPVFWAKDTIRHHADARAFHAGNSSRQADLDVFHQTTCIAVLENKTGNNILVHRGGAAIDLQIDGTNILLRPAALSFRIEGTSAVKQRTEALILLSDMLRNIPTIKPKAISKTARQNLLKALVALDCKLLGGSLRDTSIVFRALGLTRLSWSVTGDESLKKQVIRARNRGLKLMQGDYRKLLS